MGRRSPTNGSEHGHQKEVREDDIQVFNEVEFSVLSANEGNAQEYECGFIRCRYGNGFVNNNAHMNVYNNGLVLGDNGVVRSANVQVLQADVHAAPP